jgi:hypothetical protein
MGLVSTIGPVAVGVVLAFAWNMTVSQPQRVAEPESGVTPQVGLTVEEAAAQAWASATPPAATNDVNRSSPAASRPASHPRGSGRPGGSACSRVTWPQAAEPTLHVLVISACGQGGRAPGRAPGPFGINS